MLILWFTCVHTMNMNSKPINRNSTNQGFFLFLDIVERHIALTTWFFPFMEPRTWLTKWSWSLTSDHRPDTTDMGSRTLCTHVKLSKHLPMTRSHAGQYQLIVETFLSNYVCQTRFIWKIAEDVDKHQWPNISYKLMVCSFLLLIC